MSTTGETAPHPSPAHLLTSPHPQAATGYRGRTPSRPSKTLSRFPASQKSGSQPEPTSPPNTTAAWTCPAPDPACASWAGSMEPSRLRTNETPTSTRQSFLETGSATTFSRAEVEVTTPLAPWPCMVPQQRLMDSSSRRSDLRTKRRIQRSTPPSSGERRYTSSTASFDGTPPVPRSTHHRGCSTSNSAISPTISAPSSAPLPSTRSTFKNAASHSTRLTPFAACSICHKVESSTPCSSQTPQVAASSTPASALNALAQASSETLCTETISSSNSATRVPFSAVRLSPMLLAVSVTLATATRSR